MLSCNSKIQVIDNGQVYPSDQPMAKFLHARNWIKDFHPPNGCIGTIVNYHKDKYLIRFGLNSLIYFNTLEVENHQTDYFNQEKFKEFLESKNDFVDVIIDKQGFNPILDEFNGSIFFSIDDFTIK